MIVYSSEETALFRVRLVLPCVDNGASRLQKFLVAPFVLLLQLLFQAPLFTSALRLRPPSQTHAAVNTGSQRHLDKTSPPPSTLSSVVFLGQCVHKCQCCLHSHFRSGDCDQKRVCLNCIGVSKKRGGENFFKALCRVSVVSRSKSKPAPTTDLSPRNNFRFQTDPTGSFQLAMHTLLRQHLY